MQYITGRTYNEAQVLSINVEQQEQDEFGFTCIIASFDDASRGIKGRVNTVVFNDGVGAAVLAAYDAGNYELI